MISSESIIMGLYGVVKGFGEHEGIRGPYCSFEPSQSHYKGFRGTCQALWKNLWKLWKNLWKTLWEFVKILYKCLTNRYTAGLHDYKILYLQ